MKWEPETLKPNKSTIIKVDFNAMMFHALKR